MFKLGLNEYLGHKVLVTDYRNIKDVQKREEMRVACYMGCTAISFKVPVNATMEFRKGFEISDMEELRAVANEFNGGDEVIAFDKGLTEYLTRDELLALVSHERAHIINGDLDAVVLSETINGIYLNHMFEHRADQYGAMLYGKENMRNAILKMIRYQGELAANEIPNYVDNLLSVKEMKDRLIKLYL